MIIELQLNEFPPDVQQVLRRRAIERCVKIEVVIAEFAIQTSELIRKSDKPAA